MQQDPYTVLGVQRNATQKEIKSAFRKMSKRYHPDLNRDDPTAEEKFKEVNEAYEILGDDDKRAFYDRTGSTDMNGSGGNPFTDPMSAFAQMFGGFGGFGGFGTGRNMEREKPNIFPSDARDAHYRMNVSLREMKRHVSKDITFRRAAKCKHCGGRAYTGDTPVWEKCTGCGGTGQKATRVRGNMTMVSSCNECSGRGWTLKNKCPHCNMSGVVEETAHYTIHLPENCRHGDTLHFNQKEHGIYGNAGENGGRDGDLIVQIVVREDMQFGYDYDKNVVSTVLPVRLDTFIAGGEVEVETLDGMKTIRIDSETKSVDKYKRVILESEGLNGGDFIVFARPVLPENYSSEQAEKLKGIFTNENFPEVSRYYEKTKTPSK